jgi:hypothetical protein
MKIMCIQVYYPFLSKSPGKRIHLQFPQRGPYGQRCPLTQHFYISLDISLYLKGPKKRVAPMETDAHSRALFNISFRVPSKGALPPGSPHGVPLERYALFLVLGRCYVEVYLQQLWWSLLDAGG